MRRSKPKKDRSDTKKWLEEIGLTQEDWAKKLKVHPMTVWGLLNNSRVVPHKLTLDSIRRKTPDCPMLKEFKQ